MTHMLLTGFQYSPVTRVLGACAGDVRRHAVKHTNAHSNVKQTLMYHLAIPATSSARVIFSRNGVVAGNHDTHAIAREKILTNRLQHVNACCRLCVGDAKGIGGCVPARRSDCYTPSILEHGVVDDAY